MLTSDFTKFFIHNLLCGTKGPSKIKLANVVQVTESQVVATAATASPKTPPSKPQRRKKPSNSSIVSTDDTDAFFGQVALDGLDPSGVEIEIDDVIEAASAPQAQTIPRGKDEEGMVEVEEEVIQASVHKREVVIGSESISFTPRERTEEGRAASPAPLDLSLPPDSSPPPPPQPATPGDPVEEEVIQPSRKAEDEASAPLPSSSASSTSSKSRKERGRSREKDKDKEKEKEEKKPAISEEELEK